MPAVQMPARADPDETLVGPGFDSPEARAVLRQQLGIDGDTVLDELDVETRTAVLRTDRPLRYRRKHAQEVSS